MAWKMKGEYFKNCNCLATCPCDTIGFPAPQKNCEGMFGMRILDGNFEGTKLDGLKWAGTVWWPGAVHEGNGKAQIFIDKNADEKQRDALVQILSGKAGGPLYEIMAAVVTEIDGPHFVDIEWAFDKEKRTGRFAVPGSFETTSAPLTVPATGEEQRVIVKLPGGFEYKEMEVALATISSKGPVKMDWKGTHSSLAIVEQTDQGCVA